MKKILISLILLASILISSFANAGITEQEAIKYLDTNVYIVLDYFVPYHIYGMPSDIIVYEGELYLILKMTYYDQKEMMIKLEDILLIRERKPYE